MTKTEIEPVSRKFRSQMDIAIKVWIKGMDAIPGWSQWKRRQIHNALFKPDPNFPGEFVLPPNLSGEHDILMKYLGLSHTLKSLQDCEYYFRRYPFAGLPVSRAEHFQNTCEMFFSRFYEFRERLRNYLNAIKSLIPAADLDVGEVLKVFSKNFSEELRARNGVHHSERFDDPTLEVIFMNEILVANETVGEGWKSRSREAFKKATTEWVREVRFSSRRMEQFMELVAAISLTTCPFFRPDSEPSELAKPVKAGD